MNTQNQQQINPIPLTQAEFDKKKNLLDKLLTTQEEVVKRLADAREMGDLSENGAYSAAKFELGNVRRQLRNVNHILKYAYVPHGTKHHTAHFGSTITVSDGKKELTFTLVSQYESNPLEKKLSLESPIGKAVSNKTTGDTVAVKTPNGTINYTIIEIK